VAAGAPLAGLQDQIASIDYTKFTAETTVRKHAGKLGDLHALMTTMGLYSGDYLVEWLGGILESIGITTFGDFATYTALGWFYKTAVEVVMLPVTYRVIGYIKRREPTYGVAV